MFSKDGVISIAIALVLSSSVALNLVQSRRLSLA